mmetsp:Transcript_1263/g.2727  ORF Transcript_1263/g.2727 Transcript_1263/m.2727 type:complete len:232 (-) Transcript_1263:414-1109(-)
MLDVGLFLLVAAHLVDLVLLLGLYKGVVVAVVVDKLLLLRQVDHVGAHTVHEILRVGHHHQDAGVLGQLLLEPHARLHVEMVGGLVQQEHSRLAQQRPGQRNTHPPPPRQILRLLGHEVAAEAETHEDLGRAHLEGVGVHAVDPVVNVLHDVCLGARSLHHVLREGLQCFHLLSDNVDNRLERGAVAGLRLLVEMEDVNVVGDGELARRQRREERGLAGAVSADEAVTIAE